MELEMLGDLNVSLSCEELAFGPAEERATFGLFAMTANDRLLTGGEDAGQKELRHGPHVAGYPIAEWFVWNWWRLRWEVGRPPAENTECRWDFAHRMSTIGEGYVWPNITISSDGMQSFLISKPSKSLETSLFHYIGAGMQTVPPGNLEAAIDGFVAGILIRLDRAEVRETNLHRLWKDLQVERADCELARFRRLEAQLGYEPDEADEDAIRHHLDDAARLGEEALGEIAAHTMPGDDALSSMMSAADLTDIATRKGFEANTNNTITLSDMTNMPPQPGQIEAWRLGKLFAQRIRDQERLDGQPISDSTLADFAGSLSNTISRQSGHSSAISFALDESDSRTRMSLRSRKKTGRRFDLARLIGDRVFRKQINAPAEPLFPATRAHRYRQQVQRAFAAELLSPFAFVDDMLGGDYSEEKQNRVAYHFEVSPMTIQTQLVNHRRIGLDDAPDIVDPSLYG